MTPPTPDSPIHWSAGEIARRIAHGEISAVEVARAFIARIDAVNPLINAVVVPRFEQALAEAAAADARRSAGESLGPLHGVPITIKECFQLAGTPATIGLTNAESQSIATDDGILVRRLKQAGAIILGKTNLPQLMIWHESDNPVYGRTNNPWNVARTCGGSTGGEAAIIAARGSPLGLGNDLGGSIRIPCHFCGIHGLRPSSFRVPRSGSSRTLRGFEAIVTQAGPMARHVGDLGLMLQVLTEASDGYVAPDLFPGRLGDPAAVDLSKLRIAIWTDDGVFPPSRAIVRVVRDAAAILADRGADVIELDTEEVGRLFHPNEALDLYCSLIGADGGADGRRIADGSQLDSRVARLMWMAGLSPPMRALTTAGLRASGRGWMARIVTSARPRTADGYWQLIDKKTRLVASIMEQLRSRRIDVLLCPPHALPATPHVTAFDLLAAASYSLLINLMGLPSGTVSLSRVRTGEENGRPSSRDIVLQGAALTDHGSEGLPVGVQVSALPWREDVVLAVMQELAARSAGNAADYPGNCVVL